MKKEKKLQYDLKYQKEHLRQIKFVLNENTDKDIIAFLEHKRPLQTYLKSLIREAIKKEGS
jgi:hypothetical protein